MARWRYGDTTTWRGRGQQSTIQPYLDGELGICQIELRRPNASRLAIFHGSDAPPSTPVSTFDPSPQRTAFRAPGILRTSSPVVKSRQKKTHTPSRVKGAKRRMGTQILTRASPKTLTNISCDRVEVVNPLRLPPPSPPPKHATQGVYPAASPYRPSTLAGQNHLSPVGEGPTVRQIAPSHEEIVRVDQLVHDGLLYLSPRRQAVGTEHHRRRRSFEERAGAGRRTWPGRHKTRASRRGSGRRSRASRPRSRRRTPIHHLGKTKGAGRIGDHPLRLRHALQAMGS